MLASPLTPDTLSERWERTGPRHRLVYVWVTDERAYQANENRDGTWTLFMDDDEPIRDLPSLAAADWAAQSHYALTSFSAEEDDYEADSYDW